MGEGRREHAVPARLIAGAAVVYAITLAAMAAVGMAPSIPWSFVPVLLLMNVPLAYLLLRAPLQTDRYVGRAGPALCATAGLLGLCAVLAPPLWPWLRWGLWLLLPLALFEIGRARLGRFGDWGRVLLALFLGYASIWNLNYLAAAASPEVHDAALLEMDRAFYAAWLDAPRQGPLFPVVDAPLAVAALQNAYTMLFSELFVVIGLLLVRGGNLARFLVTTFCIYVLGIVAFLVHPVVGPHLAFYPELFRPEFLDTHPFGGFMRVWQEEYRSALALHTGNGFGYFVGLPSLHVAMALWLQISLRVSPLHFWTLLPVNVLMIASTCLLGYHWIADAAAAVPVVALVLLGRTWLEGRRYSA